MKTLTQAFLIATLTFGSINIAKATECSPSKLAYAFNFIEQFTSDNTAKGWIAGTPTQYFSAQAKISARKLVFRDFFSTNIGWDKEKSRATYAIDSLKCIASDDPAYANAYRLEAHLVNRNMQNAPLTIVWTERNGLNNSGYCGAEGRSTIEATSADGSSVTYLLGGASAGACEYDGNNNGYGQ